MGRTIFVHFPSAPSWIGKHFRFTISCDIMVRLFTVVITNWSVLVAPENTSHGLWPQWLTYGLVKPKRSLCTLRIRHCTNKTGQLLSIPMEHKSHWVCQYTIFRVHSIQKTKQNYVTGNKENGDFYYWFRKFKRFAIVEKISNCWDTFLFVTQCCTIFSSE